ncbi:adropin isoform X1 [Camelus ferus]|uniref:Adropin isoform X1 n=2 Tax=Camelus TaxID=9836 RepID=A0A8B8STK6_CAMFR|nr:adropin isoform X1 [Camelus ferus]
MARAPGTASQLNGGSGEGDGFASYGLQAAGLRGGGALRCFCCRPSLAEPSREPSRAQPNVAEHDRAQPNPAPGLPPPPERRRASKRAATAAEEAPPQGEEVPARRRPPAAEAAPVAPRRERPAEAARPRGRAGGGDVTPARLLPPPARRLPSLSRRPASRCPGSSRGRAPGSTQAQDCRWTSPLPGNH